MKDPNNESLSSLYKIPYFENMAEKDLAPLAGLVKPRSYEKGELIFSADQKCRNLHILSSGEIKIFMVM